MHSSRKKIVVKISLKKCKSVARTEENELVNGFFFLQKQKKK